MSIQPVYLQFICLERAFEDSDKTELLTLFQTTLTSTLLEVSDHHILSTCKDKVSRNESFTSQETHTIEQIYLKIFLSEKIAREETGKIAPHILALLKGLNIGEKENFLQAIAKIPPCDVAKVCNLALLFINETTGISERVSILEVISTTIKKNTFIIPLSDKILTLYEKKANALLASKSFDDPPRPSALLTVKDKRLQRALIKNMYVLIPDSFLLSVKDITDREFILEVVDVLLDELPLEELLETLGINSQEEKVRIAENIIKGSFPFTLGKEIRALNIEDSRIRIALVNQLADISPEGCATCEIANFQIPEEERIKLAQTLFKKLGIGFLKHIGNFQISDQNELLQYAKIYARENIEDFLKSIKNFIILDEAHRIQLFEDIISSNPLKLKNILTSFEINRESVFAFLKILALRAPAQIACLISDFTTLNAEERASIARIIYEKDLPAFVVYFHLFQIKDPILIAEHIAADRSISSEALKDYYVEGEATSCDDTLAKISDKEIIVAGIVLSDGLGDFFNILEVANALKSRYPGQKIRLLMAIERNHYHKNARIFICPPEFSYEIVLIRSSDYMMPSIKWLPFSTRNKLKDATYTINISPAKHNFKMPFKADLSLLEPGHEGSIGLSKEDFGVLIPTINSLKESDLKSLWLKSQLSFDKSSSLGMLYFNNEGGLQLQELAIESAIAISPHEHNLTLVCNMTPDEKVLKEKLLPHWKSLGITDFILEKEGEEMVTYTLSEITPKRSLRILKPSFIPHSDMLILQKIVSLPFTGCTGDQSFAELIAINHCIPLYQVRAHKEELFRQYCEVAQELLGTTHPYVQYLEFFNHRSRTHLFNPSNASSITALLANPDCLKGAKALHEWIKEHKNASKLIAEKVAEEIRLKEVESGMS